jgi:preprotein translocase subunit SecG
MEAVLLVIHLIIALAIIALVLIQPSESGGFLGNGGSMSNVALPRRSGNPLTRATTILAGIFFLTSLLLASAAGHRPVQKSILDAAVADQPAAVLTTEEAPAMPGEEPAAAPETPKAPISK